MNCKKCLNPLPESAKYCPQCGSIIAPADEANHLSKISEMLNKPVYAYGLVVLTSIVAMAIVFLIMESNQRKDDIETKTSPIPSEISTESKALQEKLSTNPDDLQSNIRLGNLLFDSGDFAGAIPFYAHATHLDSLNIAVRIDMAVCYFNLQNYPVAIDNMKKALELEPTHVKGLFNIGVMYSQAGEKEKARRYWDKLIGLYPQSAEGIRARQLLEGLK